jgi:hypothetical protein
VAYRTFVSRRSGWRIYDGIGDRGRPHVSRDGAPVATHLAQSAAGELWATVGEGPRQVVRVEIPGLSTRSLPDPGARLGALAVSPDGGRVLVTALPDGPNGQVELLVSGGPTGWLRQPTDVAPHISSRLAWLDTDRVVFESAQRRLTVLALATGSVATLRPGRLPTAAPLARRWHAVVAGKVVEVGYDETGLMDDPAERGWRPVRDVRFGEVSSLAVTPDGAAFLWTSPKFLYQVKGFAQRRGGSRVRMRSVDVGVGIILSATSAGA